MIYPDGYCWRYLLAWGYSTWTRMVLNDALLINILDGLWSILQVIFLQNVLQFVKVFIDCLQRGSLSSHYLEWSGFVHLEFLPAFHEAVKPLKWESLIWLLSLSKSVTSARPLCMHRAWWSRLHHLLLFFVHNQSAWPHRGWKGK